MNMPLGSLTFETPRHVARNSTWDYRAVLEHHLEPGGRSQFIGAFRKTTRPAG